jgi:hypothetical protein
VVEERKTDLVNWTELVDPMDSFLPWELIVCREAVQAELVQCRQVKSPGLPASSRSSLRIQRFVSIVATGLGMWRCGFWRIRRIDV